MLKLYVKIINFVSLDLPGQGLAGGCLLTAFFVVILLAGLLAVTGNMDKLDAITH